MKPRCPVCRSRRATAQSLLAHQHTAAHLAPCTCGGYHYPHRPYSPYCYLRPTSTVLHALRGGDMTPEAIRDALEDIAFYHPGRRLVKWPY